MKKDSRHALRIFKGFTLIEILVVIAIIGTLSALLLPNFMDARARARDAQRKSDLNQIQKALEMYKNDQVNQSYPDKDKLPAAGLAFSSASGVYMKAVPKDPLSTDSTPIAYLYTPVGVGPVYVDYILCACLENIADTELVAGDCSVEKKCTGTKSYQLTAP